MTDTQQKETPKMKRLITLIAAFTLTSTIAYDTATNQPPTVEASTYTGQASYWNTWDARVHCHTTPWYGANGLKGCGHQQSQWVEGYVTIRYPGQSGWCYGRSFRYEYHHPSIPWYQYFMWSGNLYHRPWAPGC